MNVEYFLAGFGASLGLWVATLLLGAAFAVARRIMKG